MIIFLSKGKGRYVASVINHASSKKEKGQIPIRKLFHVKCNFERTTSNSWFSLRGPWFSSSPRNARGSSSIIVYRENVRAYPLSRPCEIRLRWSIIERIEASRLRLSLPTVPLYLPSKNNHSRKGHWCRVASHLSSVPRPNDRTGLFFRSRGTFIDTFEW